MDITSAFNRLLQFTSAAPDIDPKFDAEELKLSFTFDYLTGVRLIIQAKDESLFFYFYCRTMSWNYSGERTDLQDIFSSFLAAYLVSCPLPISCQVRHLENPATCAEDEVYAAYIIPVQYNSSYRIDLLEHVKLIEGIIILFHTEWRQPLLEAIGCPCGNCAAEIQPSYRYKFDDESDFYKKMGKETPTLYSHSSRLLPNWHYYRDFDEGISIIESVPLASLYRKIGEERIEKSHILQGTEANIFYRVSDQSTLSFALVKKAKELLLELGDNCYNDVVFIPTENVTIACGNKFSLLMPSSSGYHSFEEERERIRTRRQNEAQLLFPVTSFVWSETPNGGLFESMIKELLERENEVQWVRQVAPTNQPDDGRDLIMDVKVLRSVLSEKSSPFLIKKIIVQCKHYRKSVGRNHVLDIRDTLDHFGYDGFFLAVSSQITTPLTNKLDKLKQQGYYVDWWNRDDLESRLNRHRDVLERYSGIVRIT